MSILTPHIAAALFDTPLMIAPDKAAAMLMGLGGRVVDGGVVLVNPPSAELPAVARQSAGIVSDRLSPALDRHRQRGYDVVDDIAVIAVEGSLVQKGSWIGQSSGQTTYQGLQVQITRALKDPSLKAAVVEVDSLGGQVSGAFETADLLHQLSRKMPTMAILTDTAASAGYLQASQCRQVVMPASGAAGSIGVISLHVDVSAKADREGVKVTLITAGEHKADGNPFEPLNDEFAATLRSRNEATRQAFAATVARGRGARLTKAQALATEARVYFGKDAVAKGLVDAIAPAAAAFAAFSKAVHSAA